MEYVSKRPAHLFQIRLLQTLYRSIHRIRCDQIAQSRTRNELGLSYLDIQFLNLLHTTGIVIRLNYRGQKVG